MTAFGAFIIGDEILSGRRTDQHLPWLVSALARRGLRLAWVCYLGDDPERLEAAFRQSFAAKDYVISFGGIGATPDDHTRAAAARALGVALRLHPEAEALIRARLGAEATPERLEMGCFPEGARLIPNPYNQIPGFSVGHHHFVPGFPRMAWPMVEWVLDTYYRDLTDARFCEESCLVWDVREGELLTLMRKLTERHTEVRFFSLPSLKEDTGGRWRLELGFKGPCSAVQAAMQELVAELAARGITAHKSASTQASC